MDNEIEKQILHQVENETSRKRRVFKKLDKQISWLIEDVPTHFMDIGESFHFVRKWDLFDCEFADFDPYLRSKSNLIDRAVVYKLIRIYRYFKDYFNTERGRVFLYSVGYAKLLLLVENQEKFVNALAKNVLNFDDLTMYAYQYSVSDLKDLLEEQSSTELCRDIFRQTILLPNCDIEEEEIYIEGFLQIINCLADVYDIPYAKKIRDGVSSKFLGSLSPQKSSEFEGTLSEQKLLNILGSLREIAKNLGIVFSRAPFSESGILPHAYFECTRPNQVANIEDYVLLKANNEFGLFVNKPDLIREMVRNAFLDPQQMIRLTGLTASEFYYWSEFRGSELANEFPIKYKESVEIFDINPTDYEELDSLSSIKRRIEHYENKNALETNKEIMNELLRIPENQEKTITREFSLRVARKFILIKENFNAGLDEERAVKRTEEILAEEEIFNITQVYRDLSKKVDVEPGFYLGGDELRSIRRKGTSKENSE